MLLAGGRLVTGVRLHCPGPQWTRLTLIAHDPLPVRPSNLARQHQHQRPSHGSVHISTGRRFYADGAVSRPKAHTGRTTRKARAQKSATPKTAAEKATASTPTAQKKATPPKKATAKTKAKTRAKTKPKRKPKPKPKPQPKRKVLTDEQKKKKAKQNANEKLKELKKLALLDPPKQLPDNAWIVFSTGRAATALKKTTSGERALLSDVSKQSAAAYKELSPEEIEHYNHLANQNKVKNRAAYHTWISSYSPKEIEAANRARRVLARRVGKENRHKYPPLKDERLLRKPANGYSLFFKDRFATGDLKGIHATESAKLIAREWKALSDDEKTAYRQKSDKLNDTYKQERAKVFGD